MTKEKIKRLDSKKRLEQFKLDKILEIMDIKGNEIIYDIGAGTGAFSVPIAQKLTSGHLYAYDINADALDILRDKISNNNINNITPVHIGKNTPNHSNKADKIYICTVLHEIENKDKFIANYKSLLMKNGKMYIVEFADNRRHLGEVNPPKRHFISKESSKDLLEKHFEEVGIKQINDLIYICICS